MERPSRAMISTFSPAATGADDRASQIAPSTKILPVGARAVRAATIWPTRTPAPVRSGSRFTASALNESSARIVAVVTAPATSVASSPRGAPGRSGNSRIAPSTIATAPPTARTPCAASLISRKKNRAPSTRRPIPAPLTGRTDIAKSARTRQIAPRTPGRIAPGVLGAICLVLALFAMSVLPVSGAGMGLLVLGALFFFLEIKLAAHGVLAVGGAVAIVLGAILLFPDRPGAPRGELATLVAGAVTTATILALLSFRALAVKRLPDRTGAGVLVGQIVAARTALAPKGKIFVDGAIWEARSSAPVAAGENVEIMALDGLSILVRPAPKGA